jgi:hypothetical protein
MAGTTNPWYPFRRINRTTYSLRNLAGKMLIKNNGRPLKVGYRRRRL